MINKTIRKKFTNQTEVIYKHQLKPDVFHIKIQSDYLKNLDYTIGQHFHVLVNPNSSSLIELMTNRSYSIWQHDKTAGIIDMAICKLGQGPGSLWIDNLQVGDIVYLTNPTGRFVLSQSFTHHIFIGDVSTLSHFYNMVSNLNSEQTYEGFVYEKDRQNIFSDITTDIRFMYIKKDELLLTTIKSLVSNIPSTKLHQTMFYLGGDGDVCIPLNKMLKKDFSLSKDNLTVKPFWKKNKKGL